MSVEYIPGAENGTDEAGQLACDVDTVHTISVVKDSRYDQKHLKRAEILDFGNEGFLLHNLLTEDECTRVIEAGEKIEFGSIRGANDNYRSAQRITVNSSELADLLWERIKAHVEDIEISDDPQRHHIHGIPFVTQGKWQPSGLNSLFRLCKYEPGGHFAPHFDGFYAKSAQERSLKTLMVYLNGDFSGGSTNFVNENQTLYKDESGKYCAEDKNIICRIQPETGMAILFNHHRLHEGQQLKDNKKYILRTDIMYRKTDVNILNKHDEEALQLMQEAERLEGMGDCMEAAQLYRKAFKLSPELEMSS